MKLLATLLVVAATLMAACGAPASSPGTPTTTSAEPAPLGSPSAAETREISMQVSGLI